MKELDWKKKKNKTLLELLISKIRELREQTKTEKMLVVLAPRTRFSYREVTVSENIVPFYGVFKAILPKSTVIFLCVWVTRGPLTKISVGKKKYG